MNGRRSTLGLVAIAVGVLVPCAQAPAAKETGPGKVKTRSATASGSGHQTVISASATCPKGTRAVGGGFAGTQASAEVIPIVFESRRLGQRKWTASSQLNDAGVANTASLTAFVYCRAGVPKASEASAAVGTPDANQVGPIAIATCPGKKNAIAGGFSTPPPVAGLTLTRVIALESTRVADGSWAALPGSTTSGSGSSLTAFAYCAKQDPPAARIGIGPPTGGSASVTTADANCKSKERAGAGGFAQPGAQFVTPTRLVIPFESRRTGNGWRASGLVSATVGGIPFNLIATSYCG